MNPIIESPGIGLQHFAIFVRRSPTPNTSIPDVGDLIFLLTCALSS